MKTLIVEDDYLSRALLSTMLSEYGVCHFAENGQEGLELFEKAYSKKDPYTLICLDIMMPVLDGLKTLVSLREKELQKGVAKKDRVKVIMVTAIDDKDSIINAFKAGECEAYLTKPVDKEKLIGHIHQLGLVDKR